MESAEVVNLDPETDCKSSYDEDSSSWHLWVIIGVVISYFLANYYVLFANLALIKIQAPSVLRTLNMVLAPPVFMLGAISIVVSIFAKWKFVFKMLRFSNWHFWYIFEGAGLEVVCFIPLTLIAGIIMIIMKYIHPFFPEFVDFATKTSNAVKAFALNSPWSDFAIFAFAAAIMAPIVEEIIFRGILYSCFRRYIGTAPSVIITSLLFASLHFNIIQFIPLFMLGAIFQLLYIYHKSIFPGMIYHAVNNGVAVLIMFVIKYYHINIPLT